MRFGRVEGLAEFESVESPGRLHLRVILETAQEIKVVREEIVPMLDRENLLPWQVDQYTQETIGVDLAEDGWEVIGAGDLPAEVEGPLARSATYAVRQL